MQAIEFKAKIKDGVIEIPKEYLKTLSKEFRVIIPVEQKETVQEPKREEKAFKSFTGQNTRFSF